MAPCSTFDIHMDSAPYGLSFKTFGNVINGEVVDTAQHRTGVNPVTMECLPEVPISTKKDLDAAVNAARIAFPKWSQTPYAERKAALLKFADAIEALAEPFAKMLNAEQGKPMFQADGELDAAVMFMRGSTELRDVGEPIIIEDSAERKIYTRYTPLGIVGALVPWNFPVQLTLGKINPAVLTGNTVIVKPSPFTPYCGLKIVELAQKFFPPGVIQALSGDHNLGPWITSHPDIDKISFTGSTATGKLVAASAAKTLKRLTLELGGNDPAIVCEDVDIATTAAKITTFAFLNSGQICVALKRIYIHESIYEKFRDAMVAYAVENISSGFGKFCGPIQNKMQYERVQHYYDEIEAQQQKIAYQATEVDKTGFFMKPTIIDNPAEDSRLVVEEPFGPILPIMSWKDEEDVITRANNTRQGLGSSIWTRDLVRAERMARRMESGTVWINKHLEPVPNAPFGGHKESGFGVEYGVQGLEGMCNIQTTNIAKAT